MADAKRYQSLGEKKVGLSAVNVVELPLTGVELYTVPVDQGLTTHFLHIILAV